MVLDIPLQMPFIFEGEHFLYKGLLYPINLGLYLATPNLPPALNRWARGEHFFKISEFVFNIW